MRAKPWITRGYERKFDSMQLLNQNHPGFVVPVTVLLMIVVSGCNKSENKHNRPDFVSEGFDVPVLLEHAQFTLRPIQQSDARLDYEAVMASAQQLRSQFESSWPEDDFSIEENQKQLGIHEQQFADRSAFVFTVLQPDESRVLGCVYIVPAETKDNDVVVKYWVRQSEADGELPKNLRRELEAWLKKRWPFRTAKFEGPT